MNDWAVNSSNPNMFPQLNKIFRRNNQNDLPCLKAARTNNEDILLAAGIDPNEAVDDDNFFVIEDPQEQVEAIGGTFQEVYKANVIIGPNHDLENRVLVHNFCLRNEMVNWRCEISGVNQISDENMVNNVNINERVLPPFISKEELQTILEV